MVQNTHCNVHDPKGRVQGVTPDLLPEKPGMILKVESAILEKDCSKFELGGQNHYTTPFVFVSLLLLIRWNSGTGTSAGRPGTRQEIFTEFWRKKMAWIRIADCTFNRERKARLVYVLKTS